MHSGWTIGIILSAMAERVIVFLGHE